MRGVRADQLLLQPQSLAEVERPWLVRDERVRPPLQQEAVPPFRADNTPQPGTCLQQHPFDRSPQLFRQFQKPVRRRQSRDAAPNHDDPHGRFAPEYE